MDTIVSFLGIILGYVMALCYEMLPNYGLAIILFTFLTKVILLPVSIPVHKNSIKMVKMQPELNFSKAENFGDRDSISEEQIKLYKKYNYHPLFGLVPLFIQIILLMGVVDVVRNPLKHIHAADFHMDFLGLKLSEVPAEVKGIYILVPLLAAFCAWLLCVVQNKINVLQSEQGSFNKISTMLLSVGLSLYLGFFVPAGVGLYWIFSNLFAILQLVFLNTIINPKKYVDYEQLELSKAALEKVSRRAKANKKLFEKNPYKDREKADYKAFFKLFNKQLVFYSEKNGFYKYFQNIIEYLLENSDVIIDYVTNDPKDAVFDMANDRFRVYYIGNKKMISFMMKMDADVVVMTTPDLEKYHIKRSLIRKDVEYIYLPHGVNSPNTSLRTGALDYYDTIFAQGPRAEKEIRAIEKLHNVKEKTIIPWGSSVLDNMIEAHKGDVNHMNERKTVLIAPSWQEDNLVDLCIEPMLDELLKTEYKIILRPHPQYLRYAMEYIEELREKYKKHENFELQTDFSSNATVYQADLLITDWSGISFEYSFSTLKPTLSINTPMKIMNKEWEEIQLEPIDIAIRTMIGQDLNVDEIGRINSVVEELFNTADDYREKIAKVREEEIYNLGNSGKTGAEYILNAIERIEENKEEYLKYL